MLQGFAELVTGEQDADLVLAGPAVSAVSDDPEGADVLRECWETWRQLPHHVRRRATLACIPMDDLEENAVIVNALQRHATIVVQKSLAEGFGLTVSEAMYKRRPVDRQRGRRHRRPGRRRRVRRAPPRPHRSRRVRPDAVTAPREIHNGSGARGSGPRAGGRPVPARLAARPLERAAVGDGGSRPGRDASVATDAGRRRQGAAVGAASR